MRTKGRLVIAGVGYRGNIEDSTQKRRGIKTEESFLVVVELSGCAAGVRAGRVNRGSRTIGRSRSRLGAQAKRDQFRVLDMREREADVQQCSK